MGSCLPQAGSLLVVERNGRGQLQSQIDANLSRACSGFRSLERQRFRLLEVMARSLANDPTLRNVMRLRDEPTLRDYLQNNMGATDLDLVLLQPETREGPLMVVRKPSVEASEAPALASQLGEESRGYQRIGGRLFQYSTTSILLSSGREEGVICVGLEIGRRQLESWSRELGARFVLMAGPTALLNSGGQADDQSFTGSTLELAGTESLSLKVLYDTGPYLQTFRNTRIQLVLVGLLFVLVMLLASLPLVRKVAERFEVLEILIRSIGEGLLYLNPRGRVVSMNPAAEQALKLDTPSPSFRLFHELSVSAVGQPGPSCLRDLEKPFRLDDGLISSSARSVPVSISSNPIWLDGKPAGFVMLFRDITSIKAQELALKNAASQANAAAEARSEFLAHMSHEIRTPLNGIMGMNQLLLRTSLEPAQRGYCEIIERSSRALLGLLNDVLDLSKIEAGGLTLDSQPFDLVELVGDVLDLLAPTACGKGLAFQCQVAPDLPEQVRGDSARLRQVLLNLVGNAIKFTSKGTVGVTVQKSEDTNSSILFQVSDTGIGMDKQATTQLFQPFVQANSSIRQRFGGTGLGLAISGRLTDLMGGTIRVDSEVGRGSRFSFWLPLPAVLPPRQALADSRPRRAALVGQSPELGMALRNLLEFWQFSVLERQSWDEDCDKCDCLFVLTTPALSGSIPAGRKTVVLVPVDQPHESAWCCSLPLSARRLEAVLVDLLATQEDQPPLAEVGCVAAGTEKPLVLVIDDSLVNREVAAASLKSLGYRCVLADGAQRGLEVFRESRPELILMDCQMPEMDGFEATALLRNQDPGLVVVGMTADLRIETRLRMVESGMAGFIPKPFSLEQLDRKLQQALCPEVDLDHEKLSRLKALKPEKPDFLLGLVEHFARNLEVGCRDLLALLSQGRDSEARRLAHQLRGASGNLGASQLGLQFRAIEEAAVPATLVEEILAIHEQTPAVVRALRRAAEGPPL